jgi:hypothetical protein
MMKNHRTLDDFHSGPMKKNERWMKIIQRWKKKTQRSPNFYQVLRVQSAGFSRYHRRSRMFRHPRQAGHLALQNLHAGRKMTSW